MKTLKVMKLLFISSLCLSCLVGCSPKNDMGEDILSMKKTPDDKMKITILVKHAFSILNFEKIIEETFPNIDLIQVGNYTANAVLSKEVEARLEHDDLTDIVMNWPLDVGKKYWQDRLINLSGMPFTSHYKASMLDSMVDEEGGLYYLPGPAQIRALVYNKTLFEENGWKVPNNYTEFLSLCAKIEETGIRSYQLSLGNKEVLDTAFMSSSFGNAFSKPSDVSWLESYMNGEGAFSDHFESALNTFQELIDHNIYRKEDLNLYYKDTQRNLFTRQCAMIEDSVLMARSSGSYTETDDEFALMPFFNAEPENDWARIYPTCYIGLNKHLLDKGNEKKYNQILEIMEYISTPEGQIALASDTEATYSSLNGVEAPNVKEIENLIPTLEEGRYGIFPFLTMGNSAIRKGLANMVAGTMNASEMAEYVDEEMKKVIVDEKPPVYGQAIDDFTLAQTGAFITDTIKEAANTDIALFLDNGKDGFYNNKGICAKFYKGDIDQTDLQRIFPNINSGEYGELWKVTMTGENLINTLEYTMEIGGKENWFYYFSGLKMTFNPYADPGSRIVSIETTDGKKIISDQVYSIAVMEESIPNEYIISCEKTDRIIQNILQEKVIESGTIYPVSDQRFIIKG